MYVKYVHVWFVYNIFNLCCFCGKCRLCESTKNVLCQSANFPFIFLSARFLYINLFVWFSIFVSVCLICRLLRSYGQFGLVILDISLILPYYIVVFYFFSYKLLHLFTFHPIISLAVLLAFFATFCDLKNIFFVL